jgi:hypothetical protein
MKALLSLFLIMVNILYTKLIFVKYTRSICSGKVEMSPLGKVEMSPSVRVKPTLLRVLNRLENNDVKGAIYYDHTRDKAARIDRQSS